MSAEQRRSGKPWRKMEVDFGERVMFRPLSAQARRSTMEPQMLPGRFLGHHTRTGSLIIMTENGVQLAQGLKRLPADQAWQKEDFDKLVGLPWALVPGGPQAAAVARPPHPDLRHAHRLQVPLARTTEEGMGVRSCLPLLVSHTHTRSRAHTRSNTNSHTTQGQNLTVTSRAVGSEWDGQR